MKLKEWTRYISRSLIERTDETPRILTWIYDAIDEDLEEGENGSSGP